MIFLGAVALTVTTLSLFAFPHTFLFFNALPLALSASFLSVTTVLFTFEFLLPIQLRIENSQDLSLIKIILSPRSSIARLKALLEPNASRARNELEQRVDNVAQDENHSTSLQAITLRLQNAIARLSKEAIIDDAALYEKHFSRLRAGRVNIPETELANIKLTAQESALEEAEALTEAYAHTIIPNELYNQDPSEKAKLSREAQALLTKRECYESYRKITLKLNLYGSCPVSFEEIYSNQPENFVIVEKRYSAPVYEKKTSLTGDVIYKAADPIRTEVYATRAEVYEIATFQKLLENKTTAEDPIDRDDFFNPKTYPNPRVRGSSGYKASEGASYPVHYKYYAYSHINGHGVSLGVCEAIEDFLDPSLRAAKLAALQKTTAPPAPAKKSTSPDNKPKTQSSSHSRGASSTSRIGQSNLVSQSVFPVSGSSNRVSHDLPVDEDTLRAALAAGISREELLLLSTMARFRN